LATDEAHFGGGSTYPRNFFLNFKTRSFHLSVSHIFNAFKDKRKSDQQVPSANNYANCFKHLLQATGKKQLALAQLSA
jgi:hypothetical protein